jgi:hypothetical protein
MLRKTLRVSGYLLYTVLYPSPIPARFAPGLLK